MEYWYIIHFPPLRLQDWILNIKTKAMERLATVVSVCLVTWGQENSLHSTLH